MKPTQYTRMLFGKYKGQQLCKLPAFYLEWLIQNKILQKYQAQLSRRSAEQIDLLNRQIGKLPATLAFAKLREQQHTINIDPTGFGQRTTSIWVIQQLIYAWIFLKPSNMTQNHNFPNDYNLGDISRLMLTNVDGETFFLCNFMINWAKGRHISNRAIRRVCRFYATHRLVESSISNWAVSVSPNIDGDRYRQAMAIFRIANSHRYIPRSN